MSAPSGRHLLQQLDLAEPLDLVDPKSGMDYFAAGTLLAKATYAGQTTVPAIPYWEDMFPYLASPGMSATQNIYTNVYQQLGAVGRMTPSPSLCWMHFVSPAKVAWVAAPMLTPMGMSQQGSINGNSPRCLPGRRSA